VNLVEPTAGSAGGSYSLQVFVWPPGTATRIHDHASWGAYACARGCYLRGALRAPGRRVPARPCAFEQVLGTGVERRRCVSSVLPYAEASHRSRRDAIACTSTAARRQHTRDYDPPAYVAAATRRPCSLEQPHSSSQQRCSRKDHPLDRLVHHHLRSSFRISVAACGGACKTNDGAAGPIGDQPRGR
jgi:hypothetical protein